MKLKLLVYMIVCTSSCILAQESQEKNKKKFSLSGSIDTYFRTNLTGPNTAFEEDGETFFLNPGTSFADRSGFSIGMVNTIISYEGKKIGFVADLVFGPRGEDAVFLSVGSSAIVNQLYAYYNIDEKVTLTLGNFNTFLGYEVISPTGNLNYSTSYMFSNGPFSHTGIKADVNVSEDFSFMLGVFNSTDFTETNFDGSYTLGAQLEYKNQFLNFIYGNQTGNTDATFQVDYTGGLDINPKFLLDINATYADTDGNGFYGAALYPQYIVSEKLILGLRGEYFGVFEEDIDDETVFATTLTANYKIGDLTIIPELRLDTWSDEVYVDNDLEPSKNLASFLVAAVYNFN